MGFRPSNRATTARRNLLGERLAVIEVRGHGCGFLARCHRRQRPPLADNPKVARLERGRSGG